MPKRSRKGRGDQARARRRPDEREGRQIDAHGARRRPLADDEVELEILHGGIEDLLHRRIQAMDLVDEQHVAGLQIGQQRREIAGARDHRAGGGAEADAELAGDDLGQRRLAEARRPEEQHMVEGLAAGAGGGDEDLEIGAQLLLADEFLDRLGPERGVDAVLGAPARAPPCAAPSLAELLQARADQLVDRRLRRPAAASPRPPPDRPRPGDSRD